MTNLPVALTQLLVQIPVYLVWAVGAVLALLYWKRSPRSSALLLAGLAVLALVSLVGGWLNVALPTALVRRQGAARAGGLLTVIALVRSLFAAGAWGLILAAVFVDRPRS